MGNCSSNEIIRIADTSHAMKKNPNPYNLGIDTSPKLFHSTGVKNEVKPKSFFMDNANAPTLSNNDLPNSWDQTILSLESICQRLWRETCTTKTNNSKCL